VPANATCTINNDVTIQHDLNVDKGATLTFNGATVGHDIHAHQPKGIGIGFPGSSVGHNIEIDGVSGNGPGTVDPGDNYICATTVGNDVKVMNGAAAAGQWYIGAPNECTTSNTIGHDLSVTNNKNKVKVGGNTVGNKLTVTGNTGGTDVSGNHAGSTNCKKNTGQTGSGNTPTGGGNSCPA